MRQMQSDNVFKQIGAPRVPRSAFNLSHDRKFTCDMGEAIPILADEAVPGDIWGIGNSAVARFQPLLAPILHPISMKTYYFFCPFRLLMGPDAPAGVDTDDGDWEEFITGGEDGDSVITLPVWDHSEYPDLANAEDTLWDYLGYPTQNGLNMNATNQPLDWGRRAYNFIFNEYFRNQNYQAKRVVTNESLFIKNWAHDYFTSALPWTQRGTPPVLPVTGSVTFDIPVDTGAVGTSYPLAMPTDATDGMRSLDNSSGTVIDNKDVTNSAAAIANFNDQLTDNNIISAQSVNINDLRLAFQIQRWMELNARAGARYTEYLKAHFQVAPRDDRLQRPEYIGGSSTDVIISEVLQTSEDGTTPQGNMSGHGIVAQSTNIGRYRVQEHGIIMGIMCVVPRPAYQQGINKQWLRRTKFDFYDPLFANLGEVGIVGSELCVSTTQAYNESILGYTGIFNEMRYKPNMVMGQMKDVYAYWHLGRIFTVASPPTITDSFLQCVPDKRIFAAPSEPGLIIAFGNHLNVNRPMPFIAEPMSLGGK